MQTDKTHPYYPTAPYLVTSEDLEGTAFVELMPKRRRQPGRPLQQDGKNSSLPVPSHQQSHLPTEPGQVNLHERIVNQHRQHQTPPRPSNTATAIGVSSLHQNNNMPSSPRGRSPSGNTKWLHEFNIDSLLDVYDDSANGPSTHTQDENGTPSTNPMMMDSVALSGHAQQVRQIFPSQQAIPPPTGLHAHSSNNNAHERNRNNSNNISSNSNNNSGNSNNNNNNNNKSGLLRVPAVAPSGISSSSSSSSLSSSSLNAPNTSGASSSSNTNSTSDTEGNRIQQQQQAQVQDSGPKYHQVNQVVRSHSDVSQSHIQQSRGSAQLEHRERTSSTSSSTSASVHGNKSSTSPAPDAFQTSLEVFLRFVKEREDNSIDASGVLSPGCFDEWVRTRKSMLKAPQESFRRTLTAHVTGLDGRKPFPPKVEQALLIELRQQRIWPCFKGVIVKGRRSNIGMQGFRTLGWHERHEQGFESKSRKKKSKKNSRRRNTASSSSVSSSSSNSSSDTSSSSDESDAGPNSKRQRKGRRKKKRKRPKQPTDILQQVRAAAATSMGPFDAFWRNSIANATTSSSVGALSAHQSASGSQGATTNTTGGNSSSSGTNPNDAVVPEFQRQVNTVRWMENRSVLELLLRIFNIHTYEYSSHARYQDPMNQSLSLLDSSAIPTTLRSQLVYNIVRCMAPHVFCGCYGAIVGLNPMALQPPVIAALAQSNDPMTIQQTSWFVDPSLQQFSNVLPIGHLNICGLTMVITSADTQTMQLLGNSLVGVHLSQLMDPVAFWAGLTSFTLVLFSSASTAWARLPLRMNSMDMYGRYYLTKWTWNEHNISLLIQPFSS